MGSFFEYYFSEYDFEKKETAVCCPFPHHTESGVEYQETIPSAHINLDKGVFHCKVCEKGLSEVSFISEILGCKYEAASKIASLYRDVENLHSWNQLKLNPRTKEICNELGISDEVIEELHLKTENREEDIAFPVLMYGKVVDVRNYSPYNRAAKIRSRAGSTTGMVIPFDLWINTNPHTWTIICAGEKDMAVARSNGFNAITLTGGEKALPKILKPFKNRRVAICYDHDEAGIEGAKSVAAAILPYAAEVRICTGFHEVCKEHGEDITDFFTKYKKTKRDLQKYIIDSPVFTPEEAAVVSKVTHPFVTLLEASQPKYIGRVVQSNIQVVATYEKAMPVPTTIHAVKLNINGDDKYNMMQQGETRDWELCDKTCQDVLKLVDNNFTEQQIRDNIREILGITKIERDVKIERPTKETVYQCNVTDLFEVTTKNPQTIEFVAYVIGKRLESGKKYCITYKLTPHPFKGQQLTMIILDATEAADSITDFHLTEDNKKMLDQVKNMEGSVHDKVETLSEMAKSYIGYDGYNKLIKAIDLSFHAALQFNFNGNTERGTLDTLIVTESRIGKSSTAEALQKLYSLGTFVSLAGGNATIAGIIGGSNKVNGSFQTRAGLLPMNHRGLVIFEELAKCDKDLVKALTDTRSSGSVKITRVSGDLQLPALVRMITLSNVKSSSKNIQPIASYPNGITILVDLIGAPEDIARYDLMLVMGETGNRIIDPNWRPITPFEPEVYKTKIRWVWSRNPDQIIITRDVVEYIFKKCNELNSKYDSHIKIFGTEAWKKVARLATAIAGYVVSTDDTYEKIIVTTECVDEAVDYLISCYDNNTFKLKEYVDNERRYGDIDDDGIKLLQDIYNQSPMTIRQLSVLDKTNRMNLTSATGLDNDMYNKLMNRLVQGAFVKFDGYDIVPTERFRKGFGLIDKSGNIVRLGEFNA